MERITISIESELASAFDVLSEAHGYASRSEAIRDLMRGWLASESLRAERSAWCVAQIGFVYSHRDRTLVERLAAIEHDHHDLVVSSNVVQLDHDHRLETLIARGQTQAVRALADLLVAQRGVRHGGVSIIPVDRHEDEHGHSHAHPHSHAHGDATHVHLKPVA